MFKAATVFQFTSALDLGHDVATLCEKLKQVEYQGVPPMSFGAQGFVPPLPEHIEAREMVYPAMGRLLMLHIAGDKKLDKDEIADKVQARVSELEEEAGRKVGKKERDQIKDEVVGSMLPEAYVKERRTYLYISPAKGLLVIASSSAKQVESISTQLRGALGSLGVARPMFKAAPEYSMTAWLDNKELLPVGFSLQVGAVLKTGEGAQLSIKGDDPAGDVAKNALEAGYKCVQLDLMYSPAGDDRTAFRIDADFVMSAIKEADILKAEIDDRRTSQDDSDGVDSAVVALNVDFPLVSDSIEAVWAILTDAVGIEQPPVMW